MIDVSKHIDKLEVLKEYMAAKIHVDVLRHEIMKDSPSTSVSYSQAEKPFIDFGEYYKRRSEMKIIGFNHKQTLK